MQQTYRTTKFNYLLRAVCVFAALFLMTLEASAQWTNPCMWNGQSFSHGARNPNNGQVCDNGTWR